MVRNITDILRNYKEVPSSHCWDSIDQALQVLSSEGNQGIKQPENPSQLTTHSSSSFFQGISTVSVKIVIAVVTVVAVSITATILILQSKEPVTEHFAINADTTIFVVQELTEPDLLIMEDNHEIETLKFTEIKSQSKEVNECSNSPEISTAMAMPVVNHSISDTFIVNTSFVSDVAVSTASKTDQITKTSSPVPTVNTILHPSQDPVVQSAITHSHDFVVSETPAVKLEFPNVFTPNGDGINDYFEIVGIEHCVQAHLIIKNYSGRVIYENKHYENDWNGNDLEEGNYYYFFSCILNGVHFQQKGVITILR